MGLKNVARNVWQLSDLLPNSINAYLIDDVLIDAGTRLAKRSFIRALTGVDLKLLALTHCHPDHQGAAKAICEFFGCDLACHEADKAAMEGREPMGPNGKMIRVSDKLFSGPRHPVARVLKDGDDVAGFRVIETPGHTMGHLAFFREEDRLAIVGDVMLNMSLLTLAPGLHEPPDFFCVDHALNRRSIRKVADLKPDTVLFGHGPPLREGRRLREFADRLPA
jgi:glyoxylase-like metal-dependent hydrolase (beta-lactamase superfamily II)